MSPHDEQRNTRSGYRGSGVASLALSGDRNEFASGMLPKSSPSLREALPQTLHLALPYGDSNVVRPYRVIHSKAAHRGTAIFRNGVIQLQFEIESKHLVERTPGPLNNQLYRSLDSCYREYMFEILRTIPTTAARLQKFCEKIGPTRSEVIRLSRATCRSVGLEPCEHGTDIKEDRWII